MKKMLYIMGVEWGWIFQRPQVLALALAEEYDLTVACPKQPVHARHQNNVRPEKLISLFQIPFQEKSRLLGMAAQKWHRHKLGDLQEYDVIWVGYPLYGRYLPDDYRGTVVYDCMDNFEALYPDRNEKNLRRVCEEERRLLERADIVFVSSLKLRDKMLSLCPGKAVTLVRNGYSGIQISAPCPGEKKERYTLGYIGTISDWFDDRLLEESLSASPRIRYEMIGPAAGHRIIQDVRVAYRGVVEHGELGDCVRELDCLIMPFRVNDIILYVDPVKLYEYIAWGKCIIASWYPEIDRFEDFVYFYHDAREYLELVERLCGEGFPAKYTGQMQRRFLEENTWDARIRSIEGALRANEERGGRAEERIWQK